MSFPDSQSETPLSPAYDAAEPADKDGKEAPLYPVLPEGTPARWPRADEDKVGASKKRESGNGDEA